MYFIFQMHGLKITSKILSQEMKHFRFHITTIVHLLFDELSAYCTVYIITHFYPVNALKFIDGNYSRDISRETSGFWTLEILSFPHFGKYQGKGADPF